MCHSKGGLQRWTKLLLTFPCTTISSSRCCATRRMARGRSRRTVCQPVSMPTSSDDSRLFEGTCPPDCSSVLQTCMSEGARNFVVAVVFVAIHFRLSLATFAIFPVLSLLPYLAIFHVACLAARHADTKNS